MDRRAPVLFLLALTVAACDSEPALVPDAVNSDPKMDAVLFLPIMVDPDLSQQNRRNIAVEPGGPIDTALPGPFPKSPAGPSPAPSR